MKGAPIYQDLPWVSSTYRRHVAVTALAGIAFLSAGSTPNRGKYGKNVEKVVQYLLACTDATGLISAVEHRQQNPMYGHGFATLFLAEVYGMTQRPDIREKLKLAVNLIVTDSISSSTTPRPTSICTWCWISAVP